jgi:hypothetical protein
VIIHVVSSPISFQLSVSPSFIQDFIFRMASWSKVANGVPASTFKVEEGIWETEQKGTSQLNQDHERYSGKLLVSFKPSVLPVAIM